MDKTTKCKKCNCDIIKDHSGRMYCLVCAEENKKESCKKWYQKNREKLIKPKKKIPCGVCGVGIIKDHNCRRFCLFCAKQKALERKRRQEKKWRESHKEERARKMKLYGEKNRDRINKYGKEWSFKIRGMVLEEYGGKCKCCGEKRKEFLCIDHINGGGSKHKKERNGMSIYLWLKKENYPKNGYRILCHNCNLSKGFYGYCPHENGI